jgi:uncharacterized protein
MADSPLPHTNLYTRLRASSTGIGVFAIRDIPESTKLFVGDTGETLRVPVSIVDKLKAPELRRMYYDFCPVVEGYFIAPVDFNLITMGWYLNHSNNPNVQTDTELRFIASRLIRLGEELTADYTTYSEHAAFYVRNWDE